jgi:hypothetical protein
MLLFFILEVNIRDIKNQISIEKFEQNNIILPYI